jgi:spore coat polysaccharide biosynthesis protein SpsF
MHVVAIVQARMGSTRLPGKVMLPLGGTPAIAHVLRRAAAIPGVHRVVLATSTAPQEQPLVDYVLTEGLAPVVRGSELDPLSRYQQAASEHTADVILRITGDCPLLDPAWSGRVLARLREADGALDYVNNTIVRTLPRGLDTEAFTRAALEEAFAEARLPEQREHVTPFLWGQPDRYRLACVSADTDTSAHRWTLDTEDDYTLLRNIFDAVPDPSALFGHDEVMAVLAEHPGWPDINRHVEQKKLLGRVR